MFKGSNRSIYLSFLRIPYQSKLDSFLKASAWPQIPFPLLCSFKQKYEECLRVRLKGLNYECCIFLGQLVSRIYAFRAPIGLKMQNVVPD